MREDEKFMKLALKQAEIAGQAGDVPIGAVLVKDSTVLAEDCNRREQCNDATAHAEMLVLRKGGNILGGWRLGGCTLYVTLEPCPMCAGALVLARVERLVYGAADPKSGAAGSVFELVRDQRLNHCLEVTGGILETECAGLLRDFFKDRRD